jgi:hypothetical protein
LPNAVAIKTTRNFLRKSYYALSDKNYGGIDPWQATLLLTLKYKSSYGQTLDDGTTLGEFSTLCVVPFGTFLTTKQSNLKLKTQSKQLLGYLSSAFMLTLFGCDISDKEKVLLHLNLAQMLISFFLCH